MIAILSNMTTVKHQYSIRLFNRRQTVGDYQCSTTAENQACWQALEIAQLDATVKALPLGLDSVVGRSGVRFSGGQRQRLAIARMVLAEPKVVILDEATSALDAATEYNLHQALARFLSGRTNG